ncbi:psychosine receptor-like [Pholidichthys leucotaenia]
MFGSILLNGFITNIPESNLPGAQCGFCTGHSTIGMVFTMQQIQEKRIKQQMDFRDDVTDMMDCILQFGKFEGNCFRWLLKNDIKYIMCPTKVLQKEKALGISMAEEDGQLVGFGSHAKSTWKEMWRSREDGYADFVMRKTCTEETHMYSIQQHLKEKQQSASATTPAGHASRMDEDQQLEAAMLSISAAKLQVKSWQTLDQHHLTFTFSAGVFLNEEMLSEESQGPPTLSGKAIWYMNSLSATEILSHTTNHSECYLRDNSSVNFFKIYYPSVIIIAIPSNIFFLYVSWHHIRQKNELGVFMLNLALSDLTFTVGLSFILDSMWRGTWVHGSYVCMLSIFMLLTNFYTSEALLCCIAVNRYLAVVHPLKYTSLKKVGTAAAVSVTIWVLVMCFIATTITMEDSYKENKKFSTCKILPLPLTDSTTRAIMMRFFLGFIVPFLLLFFSTCGIYAAVKSNQATDEQERKKISIITTVTLLSLLFCFGPIHVTALLMTLVDMKDCRNSSWFFYPHWISVAFLSLNCLADPFLYCFVTRTGQKRVSEVVLFLRGRKENNII